MDRYFQLFTGNFCKEFLVSERKYLSFYSRGQVLNFVCSCNGLEIVCAFHDEFPYTLLDLLPNSAESCAIFRENCRISF